MFGANASATVDGGLLQLRALDWNVDGKRMEWDNYSCREGSNDPCLICDFQIPLMLIAVI